MLIHLNSLGLSLPALDAKLAEVKLVAAPPAGPADDGVLLPAQLNHHEVANVHVGGDEEGKGGVVLQGWSAGGKRTVSIQQRHL